VYLTRLFLKLTIPLLTLLSVATTGDHLGGVTLGVAVPFLVKKSDVFEDDDDLNVTALLFGAETQVSNRVKLITENWLFTDGKNSVLLLSGGIRFIGGTPHC